MSETGPIRMNRARFAFERCCSISLLNLLRFRQTEIHFVDLAGYLETQPLKVD